MDFRPDNRAADIGDQFMYGPTFLVNPVTEPGATSRQLYLPDATWYDFWSGIVAKGSTIVTAAAPLEKLPLYVRAGSIVPLGPDIEWSTQKPADPIELRVYRGANGAFILYEDENDGYNYEKGAYSTIALRWDDKQRVLTIGGRNADFPGALQNPTCQLGVFGENHGGGVCSDTKPDRVVQYAGKQIVVSP